MESLSSYSSLCPSILETSGSALSTLLSIVDVMSTNNTNTSKLVSLGCDGTIVNSDRRGGVIRLLEENLGCGGAMDIFVQTSPHNVIYPRISMDTPHDLAVFQVL